MSDYNLVVLLGRVTRDIEIKYLQSGTAVTEMGMAVSNRRKDQSGNWIEEPVFVDVTLFSRTAEVASEYLSKGSPVFIAGRLKLDQWEKDGQKRSKLRVVAEKMQLIGSKGGGGGSRDSEYSEQVGGRGEQPTAAEGNPQDDIPF